MLELLRIVSHSDPLERMHMIFRHFWRREGRKTEEKRKQRMKEWKWRKKRKERKDRWKRGRTEGGKEGGEKEEWKEGGKQFKLESLLLCLPPCLSLSFSSPFGSQKSVRDRHLSPVLSLRLRLAWHCRAGELSAWFGGWGGERDSKSSALRSSFWRLISWSTS